MQPSTPDCILVGYNDVDLGWVDAEIMPYAAISGGYRHFNANTVQFQGKRRHFTDLLNVGLSAERGTPQYLHVAETPNLACCILKSFLESKGLHAEIVNFFNKDQERLVDLLSLSPRAVVVPTTLYVNSRPIREIVDFVRRHHDEARIIVGGPHIFNVCCDHPERNQDTLFHEMGADIFVFDSQGESTLSRILEELRRPRPDLSRVPNLIYRDGGGGAKEPSFHRTEREIENNDLDRNVIRWRSFDQDYITPLTWMRTARSCAYNCAFCRYPLLGGPLMLNDISVLEEQFKLLRELGVELIYFIDDTFNIPLRRFKDLCRMIIRNHFDFKWVCYFRCANADNESFDLAREAGCMAAFCGLESGDPQILKNMNKAAKVEKYKKGIKMLKERDIMVHASFIVGFPGETRNTAMNTLELIEETAPDFYSVESYFHDPKVPVNERAEEFGLKGSGYSWEHKTMDWREAADLVELLHRNVKSSALLPLYGCDIWSVPYFLSRGLKREQINRFLDLAKRLVLKGFDDPFPDYEEEGRELAAVFRDQGMRST